MTSQAVPGGSQWLQSSATRCHTAPTKQLDAALYRTTCTLVGTLLTFATWTLSEFKINLQALIKLFVEWQFDCWNAHGPQGERRSCGKPQKNSGEKSTSQPFNVRRAFEKACLNRFVNFRRCEDWAETKTSKDEFVTDSCAHLTGASRWDLIETSHRN